MLSFTIPLLVVVVFVFLNLGIALYFSRKNDAFREYAVGSKKFPTTTLVATLLATSYTGAGLMNNVAQVHSKGLYWIIVAILGDFGIWVVGWLALRMGPFMKNLSMPETLGQAYGKYPRVLAALVGIGTAIVMVTMQIQVMSIAITLCVGCSVSSRIVTILATLILIFYAAFGGIRAVTITDRLQFITFSIILPFLAWFMFVKLGKPIAELIPFLQSQEKFQFSTLFHFDTKLVGMIALTLSILVSYIDAPIIQRVYMASGPVQAKKVFLYSSIFGFMINSFVVLIGLFAFIAKPDQPVQEIWQFVIEQVPPFFKGLICVSLLAMTMSTADSCLNTCAIMVSHDMLASVRSVKAGPYGHQILLAKITSLIVGLSGMVIAFFYKDLLQLLYFILDFSVPITAAPFILATFGFRSTSRTALAGMVAGVLTIFAWNKLVEPVTGINGAFVAMIANGLTMLVMHYLLSHSAGNGWIGPDDHFKQIKQAAVRKKNRRKQSLNKVFVNENIAKLAPNTKQLVWMGFYTIFITLLALFTIGNVKEWHICWYVFQLFVGTSFLGYALIPKIQDQSWKASWCWITSLVVSLPINVFWYWYYNANTNELFALTVTLAHLAIILFILPLHLGIGLVLVTLLMTVYPIGYAGKKFALSFSLLSLLGLGVFLLGSIVYHKLKILVFNNQNGYLKQQQQLQTEQKLKQIAYSLHIDTPATYGDLEEADSILEKVVGDVTQSIAFLDDIPLYKQDFQSIINKFSEWALFLKKRSKSKDHMLLLPTEITINALVNKLEIALESELGYVPRLLVELDKNIPAKIVCDVDQMMHLLVTAILHISDMDCLEVRFVKVQLSTTHLKYEKSDAIKGGYAPAIAFPAMAVVLSCCCTDAHEVPKVKSYYEYIRDIKLPKLRHCRIVPDHINLSKNTIIRIVDAHYGYLKFPEANNGVLLLVLPWDVTMIRDEIITKFPIENLTSDMPITPEEERDSMIKLTEFHEYVCKVSCVDSDLIAEILLLLRRCYGFKRHTSGQLFYVRAVGVAKLVTTWLFHSPKPIYASLLYDLVRYTRLPLSYIKANYNLGIFYFVQNVLSVDKHKEIASSDLYVENRFKEAIRDEQISVLYLKLAERLYDLRHAAGYSNQEEVKYMVKETLAVDIELAKKYLDPDIAIALKTAAQRALKICKGACR